MGKIEQPPNINMPKEIQKRSLELERENQEIEKMLKGEHRDARINELESQNEALEAFEKETDLSDLEILQLYKDLTPELAKKGIDKMLEELSSQLDPKERQAIRKEISKGVFTMFLEFVKKINPKKIGIAATAALIIATSPNFSPESSAVLAQTIHEQTQITQARTELLSIHNRGDQEAFYEKLDDYSYDNPKLYVDLFFEMYPKVTDEEKKYRLFRSLTIYSFFDHSSYLLKKFLESDTLEEDKKGRFLELYSLKKPELILTTKNEEKIRQKIGDEEYEKLKAQAEISLEEYEFLEIAESLKQEKDYQGIFDLYKDYGHLKLYEDVVKSLVNLSLNTALEQNNLEIILKLSNRASVLMEIVRQKPDSFFQKLQFYLNKEENRNLLSYIAEEFPFKIKKQKITITATLGDPNEYQRILQEAEKRGTEIEKEVRDHLLNHPSDLRYIYDMLPRFAQADFAEKILLTVLTISDSRHEEEPFQAIDAYFNELYGRNFLERAALKFPKAFFKAYDDLFDKEKHPDLDHQALEKIYSKATLSNYSDVLAHYPENLWSNLHHTRKKEVIQNVANLDPRTFFENLDSRIVGSINEVDLEFFTGLASAFDPIQAQLLLPKSKIKDKPFVQESIEYAKKIFDIKYYENAPKIRKKIITQADFEPEGIFHNPEEFYNYIEAINYRSSKTKTTAGYKKEAMLAMPFGIFQQIFRNNKFQEGLKNLSANQKITVMNAISITKAVYEEMDRNDPLSDSVIEQKFREVTDVLFNPEFQNLEILGPDTKVIYIGGMESDFMEAEKEFHQLFIKAGGKKKNYLGAFFGPYDDQGGSIKDEIERTIQNYQNLGLTDKNYKLLIFRFMHGGSRVNILHNLAYYLDRNNSDLHIRDTEWTAMFKGLDMSQIITIAQPCKSYDYEEYADETFEASPLLRITSNNRGMLSYGSPILDIMSNLYHEGLPITFGTLYLNEHRAISLQDPSFRICPPNKKKCIEVGGLMNDFKEKDVLMS